MDELASSFYDCGERIKNFVSLCDEYEAFIKEFDNETESWLKFVSEKDYNSAAEKAQKLAGFFEKNYTFINKLDNSIQEVKRVPGIESYYTSIKKHENLPENLSDLLKRRFELTLTFLEVKGKELEVISTCKHPTKVNAATYYSGNIAHD